MMIELNAVSCCRPGRGFFVFHKNLFSTLCSDSVLLKLLFLSGTYLHLWALFFMLFIIVFSAILSANLKKNYILPVAINTNIFHILLLNSCKDLKRLSMYSLGFLSFLFFFTYMPPMSSTALEKKNISYDASLIIHEISTVYLLRSLITGLLCHWGTAMRASGSWRALTTLMSTSEYIQMRVLSVRVKLDLQV